MPANQSSPTVSRGAMPAMLAAARHRDDSAAQASARGPPPDSPAVTNSPSPRWSSTARVSATSSTTRYPGRGVDRPYPGRDVVTSRSPASRAAASNGG